MPYQRESEKQAAMQEQAPAPEQQQQQLPSGQRQVVRGEMDPNRPGDPGEGMRIVQESNMPGAGSAMGPDQEASEQEQAEYERATEALSLVLYENPQTSEAVAKYLMPQEKVGSVAKASMMVIQQLDMKFDFDEVIIPQLTQDTVDRVIDLYENLHGDQFSDQETQGALGATWEGVMEMYGVDEENYAELTAGMSDEDFRGFEKQYKQFLGD